MIRKVRVTAARKLNQGRKNNNNNNKKTIGHIGKGAREKGSEKNQEPIIDGLLEKPKRKTGDIAMRMRKELARESGLGSGGKPLCVGWVSSVA